MNAMERILQFINKKEIEKDWDHPKAPVNWPMKGEIVAENVQLRYREGLPLVIKGISFHIKGGEKIGIIGRTGSGKSTLSLGLLRILEMQNQKQNNKPSESLLPP